MMTQSQAKSHRTVWISAIYCDWWRANLWNSYVNKTGVNRPRLLIFNGCYLTGWELCHFVKCTLKLPSALSFCKEICQVILEELLWWCSPDICTVESNIPPSVVLLIVTSVRWWRSTYMGFVWMSIIKRVELRFQIKQMIPDLHCQQEQIVVYHCIGAVTVHIITIDH